MTKESKWKEIRRAYFPFPLSLPGLFLSPSLMLKRLLQWANRNMRTQIWVFYWGMSLLFTSPHSVLIKTQKFLYSCMACNLNLAPPRFCLFSALTILFFQHYVCISSLKGADCTLALGLLVLNVLEWVKELYQLVFLSVPSLCIASAVE